MIVMASDVNERNSRNTDWLNIHIFKPNMEYYRQSFKYAGGKIWKDVPNNIHNAPSVEAFKYDYKKLKFKHKHSLKCQILFRKIWYCTNVFDLFIFNLSY